MNIAQQYLNVSHVPTVPPKILIHSNDVVHQLPQSILRPSQFRLDMPQQQQQSHTIFATHLLQQNTLSETHSVNVEQKQTEPQHMTNFATNLPLAQQSQTHTFDMNAAMNADPLLFALSNGDIVTADKLIAHGSNDDFNGNFAASDDPVLRLLSSVALKLTKIEINGKAHERRMANIERGIGLILDAMNIDSSSDVRTSKELVNKEPLGSLVSKFKRMDTVADLDKFEEKLRNPAFFKEKVIYYIIILTYERAHNEICPSFYYLQMEQLKLICSDSKMSEINLSYSIIDVMFTRKLFTRVSWAGGSKSGATKAAFRKYSRILGFFIDLVRVCHPNWSETSAIDFVKKKVISCATARAKLEPKRISRQKHRQRGQFLDRENDEGSAEDDEDQFEEDTEFLDDDVLLEDSAIETEDTKATEDTKDTVETKFLSNVDDAITVKLDVEKTDGPDTSVEEANRTKMDGLSAPMAVLETIEEINIPESASKLAKLPALVAMAVETIEEIIEPASATAKRPAKRKLTSRVGFPQLDPQYILDENDPGNGSEVCDVSVSHFAPYISVFSLFSRSFPCRA